ncbi:hypothetical protein ADUPG1_008508 [Aduncisulcus paluster]|uniref:TOG domain-containing protein n=1 Tax=Aduncisulcus paluster TaxID=2918883 RepID=A0ABQ5KS88_9EUKA|nr:hypothetical protein ADUPG1_008508 [Aduncisulcus paluster]
MDKLNVHDTVHVGKAQLIRISREIQGLRQQLIKFFRLLCAFTKIKLPSGQVALLQVISDACVFHADKMWASVPHIATQIAYAAAQKRDMVVKQAQHTFKHLASDVLAHAEKVPGLSASLKPIISTPLKYLTTAVPEKQQAGALLLAAAFSGASLASQKTVFSSIIPKLTSSYSYVAPPSQASIMQALGTILQDTKQAGFIAIYAHDIFQLCTSGVLNTQWSVRAATIKVLEVLYVSQYLSPDENQNLVRIVKSELHDPHSSVRLAAKEAISTCSGVDMSRAVNAFGTEDDDDSDTLEGEDDGMLILGSGKSKYVSSKKSSHKYSSKLKQKRPQSAPFRSYQSSIHSFDRLDPDEVLDRDSTEKQLPLAFSEQQEAKIHSERLSRLVSNTEKLRDQIHGTGSASRHTNATFPTTDTSEQYFQSSNPAQKKMKKVRIVSSSQELPSSMLTGSQDIGSLISSSQKWESDLRSQEQALLQLDKTKSQKDRAISSSLRRMEDSLAKMEKRFTERIDEVERLFIQKVDTIGARVEAIEKRLYTEVTMKQAFPGLPLQQSFQPIETFQQKLPPPQLSTPQYSSYEQSNSTIVPTHSHPLPMQYDRRDEQDTPGVVQATILSALSQKADGAFLPVLRVISGKRVLHLLDTAVAERLLLYVAGHLSKGEFVDSFVPLLGEVSIVKPHLGSYAIQTLKDSIKVAMSIYRDNTGLQQAQIDINNAYPL